jgi:hypothetical protein
MNKKSFLILALVALLALPTAAMAAAEFSLGGFIKLDAFWDSTQEGKNMNTIIARNNDNQFHHGRLKFTAQGSRFNFTIKGPKLWGAQTTGFIEMDFDSAEEGLTAGGAINPAPVTLRGAAAGGASNSYTPRLRNAFFRFDWPETELLIGQYFTYMSRWFPELAQDGPFQITGTPTARMPMIKLTQKFMGMFEVGVMVGEANGIINGQSFSLVDHAGGESTEAPQVQVHAQFAKDLYGKAAWYGKPTPFTAEVNFGWQRGQIADQRFLDTRVDVNGTTVFGADNRLRVSGQDGFNRVANAATRHTYVDPWVVQGNLFIPVIPTHSANLAGTMSLQTSWWIGQGVEAFGWTGFNSQVFRFAGQRADGRLFFDVDLMSRFGGQIMAQYYFSNQWFLTGAWGMSKAFNVGFGETSGAAALAGIAEQKKNAFAGDVVNYHHELALCLWYRPITAFKFGLQYAYARTNFFQNTGQLMTDGATINKTNLGEAHRVEFVGLFFF